MFFGELKQSSFRLWIKSLWKWYSLAAYIFSEEIDTLGLLLS